ncbi:hypothetical protein ACHAW5_003420 [Stephanodiscus triporus]|uniref:Phospholipase/carboxylesterase/thioesterase domain-containing protein n=1 Tax=Stephanodiscus triporus TaxID=2934178 RepID=A0ABD3P0D0_9STRA
MIKPLFLSAAIVASHSRFRLPSAAAMSTSTSSSSAANNNKECGGEGRSAIIFLHGLGDVSETYPAGWSSLEDDLPDIRRRLGTCTTSSPAPTIGLSINGGMTLGYIFRIPPHRARPFVLFCFVLFCRLNIPPPFIRPPEKEMPGWFDLYDWPIGLDAKDDRDGYCPRGDGREAGERNGNTFSQGGRRAPGGVPSTGDKAPFAGCVCLSGWLTLGRTSRRSRTTYRGRRRSSGDTDDGTTRSYSAAGARRGEAARGRGDVGRTTVPMGHSSHPNEMRSMAEFLERVLFPSK